MDKSNESLECERNLCAGVRIKERREELKLSLDQVSEFIGTTPGYLALIECGKRIVMTIDMIKLAEILECKIEDFFDV